jgi:phosphate/sulfate permease
MWWLMSRGFAATVQGGAVSEKTQRRQKIEFWVILIVAYAMSVGMSLYAWLH